MKIKRKYIIPFLIVLSTVIALTNKNDYPILLRRYSIDYSVFLILMFIWTIVTFRIIFNDQRYQRFAMHIAKVPFVPLIAISVSFLGILWFLIDDVDALMDLLYLNISVIAAAIVAIIIIISLILSSLHLKRELMKYALLLSSCLVSLLLVEGATRIISYRNDRDSLERLEQIAKPSKGEKLSFGQMIRVTRNPRIIYELIPDQVGEFQGQIVTINGDGFRGEPVPVDKSDSNIRILGLGDSVMFGWGVKDDEGYLPFLENLLKMDYPEIHWEIINTAVPGYNTVMEVETLKEKGLHYMPDIVIINYVDNDLHLPNFIRAQKDYLSLRKSFLKQYLGQLFRKIELNQGLVVAPFDSNGVNFQSDPQLVPERYRGMVGLEAYEEAMKELKRLSKTHQFDLIMLSEWTLPQFVKDICIQLDVPVIETRPEWEEFIHRNNIDDGDAAWRLSPNDFHPSATGHKVIAETVFKFIQQELIQQIKEKISQQKR